MEEIVLLVEDEFSNYLVVKEYLSNTQIQLLHAHSGYEAIEIARQDNRIKVVLMDLRMPQMDGFSATRHIKSIRPNLPVVAQTAYFYNNLQEQSADLGFSGFLIKPFSQKQLIDTINLFLQPQQV
jgi:CheY-like chemotaxis protein